MEYAPKQPHSHPIQKRGGSMGYGGVYSPSGESDYHDESRDYHPYYDDYDDYSEGRTSGNNYRNYENNYLQGYDYNNDDPYAYFNYEQNGRQQDFNNYDPYNYYSNAHNSRDGQAFNNYGYKDSHHGNEHFYYKK